MEPRPGRTAYYLAKLLGPPASEWLDEVRRGAEIHNSLPGFALLVGMAPERGLFIDEPDDAVSTGQMRVYRVDAVDPAASLKITLVWTDAPAPTGVGGLENQLYLQVQAPNGSVTDGDVTPFPTATNNVQQIMISGPAAGTFLIRVRGISVTQQAPGASQGTNPRQDFAVVVSNGSAMTES